MNKLSSKSSKYGLRFKEENLDLEIINETLQTLQTLQPLQPLQTLQTLIDKILLNQKFKLEKYYNVLNRFLNEKCEYDYQRITNINEIQTAFNLFINTELKDLNNYNILMKINLNDIPKINNKFIKKKLIICFYCKKRQFVNCCDKYVSKPIHTLTHIINLKII